MSPVTIIEDDLHAWADGQLSPERRLAFEQAMARDPALAARAAEIQRQNAWLRAGLDAMLHEAVPPKLVDAARPRSSSSRFPRWRPWDRCFAHFESSQSRRCAPSDDVTTRFRA